MFTGRLIESPGRLEQVVPSAKVLARNRACGTLGRGVHLRADCLLAKRSDEAVRWGPFSF